MKDTDIIHVAMGGGVKKVFTLAEGGSKGFGGLQRGGGQKSLPTKIFNCPAPHQSIYEHSLLKGSLWMPNVFDLPLLQTYVGLTMFYLGPLLFSFLESLRGLNGIL